MAIVALVPVVAGVLVAEAGSSLFRIEDTVELGTRKVRETKAARALGHASAA